MTQFILDEHLSLDRVRDSLARWTTVQSATQLWPHQLVKDDRVPMLLRALRTPTFITIDDGFWDRSWGDRRYSILYFALRADEQADIPPLLRRLLRLPEFRTQAARMGKVARVSRDHVSWWQLGDQQERTAPWSAAGRGRARR